MSATKAPHIVVDATGTPFLDYHGLRAEIVSADEAERVDAVICGDVSCFPDDVRSLCATCGAGLVHRPTAPVRPPKICLACAIRRARADRLTATSTAAQAAELMDGKKP